MTRSCRLKASGSLAGLPCEYLGKQGSWEWVRSLEARGDVVVGEVFAWVTAPAFGMGFSFEAVQLELGL